MSNWNKLRSRFRETNRDLDAEFEQFLNESLSEDSVTSPRNKTPDLKAKDFGKAPEVGTAKAWWESSIEDESSRDNVVQSWFKTTPAVKEEEEEISEDDHREEQNLASEQVQEVDAGASVQQDVGVSVTMSKDSLDGAGANAYREKEKQSEIDSHSADQPINDQDDEDYSYTEPTGTPTPTPSPRRDTQDEIVEGELIGNTETGMNTQKELEEKHQFFEKLEQEGESDLDYRKLNEMLDEETSITEQARTADPLQATGAELGNSIFNTTGLEPAEIASKDKEGAKESPEKNLLKPTMLSKVSLMDSLESSMGTAHRQKIKQIRQKQIDLPVVEGMGAQSFQDPIEEQDECSVSGEAGAEDVGLETTKPEGVETGTGFLSTSGVGELADLQEALKATQLGATNDSGNIDMRDDFGLTSKTQDNATPILSERKVDQDTVAVEKTSPPSRNQPTDILQDVTHLRPVIVSGADEEARGFSHNSSVSIPQFNQALPFPADINGTAREQQGISLSRRAGGDYAKPVLGNLDVFQARQTGFPSQSSKGFEFPETQELAPHSIVQERDLFRESISPLVKHEIPTSPSASKGLGHLASRVNESHGFSLKPVADILDSAEGSSEDETPPADSLKGIKSIAEQRRQLQKKTKVKAGHGRDAKQGSPKVPLRISKSGQGEKREKNSEGGRVRKAKSTAKQEVVGDRSRFGWRNSPLVTPSRGTRGITGKERKEKLNKSPKKQPKTVEQSSPAHLIASVESFANYLNTFVHEKEDVAGTSRVDWKLEDASGCALDESLESKRLSREQTLQKEVEHWRLMWQEERKQSEKLIDELNKKDREWKRREDVLKLEYKKEINDSKQKVFVLESRLKDINVQIDSKKRVAKGGSLKGMSEEELRKLEKEIREQDQLLTGYQQENERLYEDLKDLQIKAKTAETQMFKENQKLATEVASLKEKLERKEGIFGAAGAATLGAERIHELHSKVQLLKTNEQEMRREIDDLGNERRKLEKVVKDLERERDMALKKADEVLGFNSQTLPGIESTHAAEIERLNRKLKWYIENQELLDKDAASLKKKNDEIKELRELVQRLEAERGQTTIDKNKKERERAEDAKRIQDLQRQVREMEQIIKRRYPNSIPALIYAASAAPGDGKPLKPDESPKKSNTPSYVFLENRVKKLNRELEEREEDWSRSFRVLEQKYNGMQLEYEGQMKELQRELNDARENVTSHKHTRACNTALEKELEAMRQKSDRKTQELEAEVKVLREALRASRTEVTQTEPKITKTRRGRRDSKGSQDPRRTEENFELRLKTLSEECEEKDRDIQELRSTCAQLQRRREEMLVEREFAESTKAVQRNLEEKLDVVNSENRQLRDQVSQLSIELDQQRVRYQGSLAEVERMARQEREAAHDELCSLRTQHKKELDSVREEYAVQHSHLKMAEMSNKIASLEIVIERLKDKLARSAETEAELASRKVHEEVLKQEINQLKSELRKAKQFHTPEMQHYAQLEDKIAAMETRHNQREEELRAIIRKMQLTTDLEKDEVLGKWRNLLRKKTEETERFRIELDGILSVLEELRQQGVVIPMKKMEHLHCT